MICIIELAVVKDLHIKLRITNSIKCCVILRLKDPSYTEAIIR